MTDNAGRTTLRILEAFGEPISYGGQELFVINVLRHMDRTGMSFDLLTPYYCDNEAITKELNGYGGDVYAFGCPFRPGAIRNGAAPRIAEFLMSHHYDIIHIHSGSNSMLAIYSRLAGKAGISRIIVHSHSTGIEGWKHAVSKRLTASALRRYPDVYCACSVEAGEWRFPEDICRSSLIVIKDGIDMGRFVYDENKRDELRSSLHIDDDEVLIGCIGRLTYQKNQSMLIEILHRITTMPGGTSRDYRMILIGDGEDRSMLDGLIARYGLEDKVIFTGAVDDVAPYLQAIDVAVMPSRYEGLGIASIEAQAAGLEVIASDAMPVSAAVTGSIERIPLSDIESWLDKILIEHGRHPEQAEEIVRAGYSIGEAAEIIRALYGENADEA